MSYADTSFLASVYLNDKHSAAAENYLKQNQPRLPFSFLHWPELAKAVTAASPQAEADWAEIKTDIMAGKKLFVAALDAERVGRRAAGLMRNFYPRWKSLRSLDAMHVAAAVEGGFKTFLSFDTNSYQRVLARTQKLKVWPPLTTDEETRLES